MKNLRRALLVMLSFVFTLAIGITAGCSRATISLSDNINFGTEEVTLAQTLFEGNFKIETKGKTTTVLELPTYKLEEGFEGWYLEDLTTEIRVGSTINKNATIVAKFTEYTITYNNVDLDGVTFNEAKTKYSVLETFTLANPTRTGYGFGGWYQEPELENAAEAQINNQTGNIEVYAKWNANLYNVTYKDQGNVAFTGEHGEDHPTTHTYGTATTLKTATKEGYTFGGWYITEGCTGEPVTTLAADGYTEDITLYAKWTIESYTLAFDTNGGTAADDVTANYGEAVDLPTPTKEGFTFAGWYETEEENNGTGTQFTAETMPDLGADGVTKTLYAKWGIEVYSITYKDEGNVAFTGVHESGYPTTHTYGEATTLKSASKTGYIFDGWYTNEDCTGEPVTTLGATTYTANITLYAKWTAKSYTLTFDSNGGTNVEDVTANYGTGITLPTPTKEGYEFGGWYEAEEENNGTGTQYTATTMPDLGANNATKTLYAKWTIESYTLTFDSNGGTNADDITANYGAEITLPTPTKEGYEFGGWYETEEENNGTGEQFTAETMPDLGTNNATKTLYAKWIVESYTLAFDTNGGTEVDNITANYGAAITLPTPTREGYTFGGWYETEEENNGTGTQFEATTMPDLGADGITKTLYARWTIESYTLTFDSNDGTAADDVTANYGEAVDLPTPTREGYTFGGWYETEEENNGTGTQFEATTMPDLGADGITKTLYAKWSIAQYTIIYKDGGNTEFSGEHEENYPTTHTYGEETTLKSATREGYIFGGWYTTEGCTGEAVTTLAATEYTENITLYAKWIVESYTLTFDSNGGTEVDDITANYGAAITLPTPTKEGYDFGGWYETEESNNGTGEQFEATTMPDLGEDSITKTLYAKWGNAYVASGATFTGLTAYGKTLKTVQIPAEINGTPITAISADALEGNTVVTKVIIPEGVTTIGVEAFNGCTSLTDVYVPSTVVNINRRAFDNCENLLSIHITSVEDWLNINFPDIDAVPSYRAGFLHTKTVSLYINDEPITSLNIPEGVTEIKDYAFFAIRGFTSVTIPASVQTIGQHVFNINYTLTSVTFAEGSQLTSIGNYAFRMTAINSINLPEGLTTLGEGAFQGAWKLETVTFPSTLETIGDSAFNTTRMNDTFYLDPAPISRVNISDLEKWLTLDFSRADCNPLYQGADLYLNGTKVVNLVVPSSITEIKNYALYGAKITGITLHSNITSIGKYALSGSTITSLTIPSSVKTLGDGCLRVSELQSLTFEDAKTLESIGVSYPFVNYQTWDTLRDIYVETLTREEFETIFASATFGYVTVHVAGGNSFLCGTANEYVLSDGTKKYAVSCNSSWGTVVAATILNSPSFTSTIKDVYFAYDKTIAEAKELLSGSTVLDFATIHCSDGTWHKGNKKEFTSSTGEKIYIDGRYPEGYIQADTVSVIVPDGVTSLDARNLEPEEFLLETITIEGTLTNISEGTFKSSRLKNIYVPYKTKAETVEMFNTLKDDIYHLFSDGNIVTIHCSDGDCIYADELIYEYEEGYEYGVGEYYDHVAGVTVPYNMTNPEDINFPSVYDIYDYGTSCNVNFNHIYMPGRTIAEAQTILTTSKLNNCYCVIVHCTDGNYSGGSRVKVVLDDGTIKYPRDNDYSWNTDWKSHVVSAIVPSNTSMRQSVFSGCTNLTTVELLESVTTISNYAFNNCRALTTLTIKGTITSVGSSAFSNLAKNATIYAEKLTKAQFISKFSGLSYATAVCSDETFTVGNGYLFTLSDGTTKVATSISSDWRADIVEAETPANGFSSISSSFFNGCTSLTTLRITVSSSITVSGNAFSNCESLANIYAPNLTRAQFESIFLSAEIQDVHVYCSDDDFNFRGGRYIYTLQDGSTVYASTSNGQSWAADVVSVEFRDANQTTLSSGVFNGCTSLTSVIIPSSVTTINNSAFYNCENLTEVTFNAAEITLFNNVFYNCPKLTTIRFLANSISVNAQTFNNCSALTDIYVENIDKDYFDTTDSRYWSENSFASVTIHCSNDEEFVFSTIIEFTLSDETKKYATKVDYSWRNQVVSAVVQPNVKAVIHDAFYECTNLTSVTLSNTVTLIGSNAFYNCTSLTGIELPDTLVSIGSYAFYNCSNLTSIALPNAVTSIDYNTFYGCSKLTSIVIPSSLTEISSGAFGYSSECALEFVYYNGTEEQYDESGLSLADEYAVVIFFYSEEEPETNKDKYWHYVDTVPTYWAEPESYYVDGSTLYLTTYGLVHLENLVVPEGVTDISLGDYYEWNIKTITLSADYLDNWANNNWLFSSSTAPNLQAIYITDMAAFLNGYLYYDDGHPLYSTEYDRPDGVALYLNNELVTEVTIPAGLNNSDIYHFDSYKYLETLRIADGACDGEYGLYICLYNCVNLTTIIVDDADYANSITDCYDTDSITKFYIKTGLDTSNSSWLNQQFTKQETSDKEGYDMWTPALYYADGSSLYITENGRVNLVDFYIPGEVDGNEINYVYFDGNANYYDGWEKLVSIHFPESVTYVDEYVLGYSNPVFENIYVESIASFLSIEFYYTSPLQTNSSGDPARKLYVNNVLLTSLEIPAGLGDYPYFYNFSGYEEEITALTILDGAGSYDNISDLTGLLNSLTTVTIDDQDFLNNYFYSSNFNNAPATVYVEASLEVDSENGDIWLNNGEFDLQETSDKEGYNKWVYRSE